jgi:hypothetical protein
MFRISMALAFDFTDFLGTYVIFSDKKSVSWVLYSQNVFIDAFLLMFLHPKWGSLDLTWAVQNFSENSIIDSVAEPHHFYAAPAAPVSTLLYSKAIFRDFCHFFRHEIC